MRTHEKAKSPLKLHYQLRQITTLDLIFFFLRLKKCVFKFISLTVPNLTPSPVRNPFKSGSPYLMVPLSDIDAGSSVQKIEIEFSRLQKIATQRSAGCYVPDVKCPRLSAGC